jgi:hypothetical protein
MKTLLLATSTILALGVGSAYAGGGDGDDHLRQWALSVEQHDANMAAAANHNSSAPHQVAGLATEDPIFPRPALPYANSQG